MGGNLVRALTAQEPPVGDLPLTLLQRSAQGLGQLCHTQRRSQPADYPLGIGVDAMAGEDIGHLQLQRGQVAQGAGVVFWLVHASQDSLSPNLREIR